MKQSRWIMAAVLILTMLLLGGCAGRDAMDDGRVDTNVIDDGMTNQGRSGGILSDIADGVENGIDNIRNGMDTVEDDMRTDLGADKKNGVHNNNGSGSGWLDGGSANGNGTMSGN